VKDALSTVVPRNVERWKERLTADERPRWPERRGPPARCSGGCSPARVEARNALPVGVQAADSRREALWPAWGASLPVNDVQRLIQDSIRPATERSARE